MVTSRCTCCPPPHPSSPRRILCPSSPPPLSFFLFAARQLLATTNQGYGHQLTGSLARRNGDESTISSIVKTLSDSVTKLDSRTEVVVAPSPLFLLQVRDSVPKGVGVAAQNVFDKPNGAWTGEVSAQQLKAARIDWTLTGHSERRHTPTIKESEEVSFFFLFS